MSSESSSCCSLFDEEQDEKFLNMLNYRKTYQVGDRMEVPNPQRFKVDDDGFVIVYTDGACPSNGHQRATAGIGVWFGPKHHLNVSEPLDGHYTPTNQVAEIKAAIEAIEVANRYGVGRLEIRTDSKYLCNCMNDWIFKWLANGWKTSKGKTLGHRELFRDLLYLMEVLEIDVCFRHIRGHNQDRYVPHRIGNNGADYLAREGAKRY